MRRLLLITSIILTGLLGFLVYCWVLIGWYQDLHQGYFKREPLTMLLESAVIIAYCYLAYRFIQCQQKRIQLPGYTKGK